MIVKLWSSHSLFGAVQSSVQCVVVLAGLRVSQVLKLLMRQSVLSQGSRFLFKVCFCLICF